jgi:hypothetical protein
MTMIQCYNAAAVPIQWHVIGYIWSFAATSDHFSVTEIQ